MIRSKFWNVHPGGCMEGEWGEEGLEALGQVLLIHGLDHDHDHGQDMGSHEDDKCEKN